MNPFESLIRSMTGKPPKLPKPSRNKTNVKRPRWTAAQVASIHEQFLRMPIREIRITGRSQWAVADKCYELGLAKRNPICPHCGRRYTEST